MATVTCPTCARKVDDDRETCPNCGQRLDGIGLDGPRPAPDAPPEAADEAADFRVSGPEVDHGVPRDAGEDTPDVEADPGVPPPVHSGDGAAPGGTPGEPVHADRAEPTEPTVTDAEARPGGGIAWRAVLSGFVAFLLGDLLFGWLLPPLVALVATVAVGLGVTWRMAPRGKMLHASLALLLYFAVTFALALILTPMVAPDGAAPPAP